MVELALDVRAELGEGPLWDDRRQQLLFVDIMRGHVHAFDPRTGIDRVFDVKESVGAIACTERGDWLLASGLGFARLDPGSGSVTSLASAAPGRHDLRMNDGYVDARGRFWAGTLSLERAANQGTLYRLDPDGTVHTMVEAVTTSNGIDWSPDGTLMYFVDTRTRQVDVFDFDEAQGVISNRRPFVRIAETDGSPDGLIVDADGGVWVALWGGGAVCRFTPDGSLERKVALPVTFVTKCAFGGPTLEDLYVTTAWKPLDERQRQDQPHAGSVFHLCPGVKGKPNHRFAG